MGDLAPQPPQHLPAWYSQILIMHFFQIERYQHHYVAHGIR